MLEMGRKRFHPILANPNLLGQTVGRAVWVDMKSLLDEGLKGPARKLDDLVLDPLFATDFFHRAVGEVDVRFLEGWRCLVNSAVDFHFLPPLNKEKRIRLLCPFALKHERSADLG